MVKGITQDCRALWLFLHKTGGWWSVLRVTSYWQPTFSLADVEEHLCALHKAGFVQRQEVPRAGTVYAVTAACNALPGTDDGNASLPSRPGAVTSSPITAGQSTTYRAGALDYMQCPSLHMCQRRAFRSEAV